MKRITPEMEYQHGIEVLRITARRYLQEKNTILTTICPNACDRPCDECFKIYDANKASDTGGAS